VKQMGVWASYFDLAGAIWQKYFDGSLSREKRDIKLDELRHAFGIG
jgi:hypothetical protein